MCHENKRVQTQIIDLLRPYDIVFQQEPDEIVSFLTQLKEVISDRKEARRKKKRSVLCGRYYWELFISCADMNCLDQVFSQLGDLWCSTCGYIVIHPDEGYDFDRFDYYRFYLSQFKMDLFCTLNILWIKGS